MKRYRRQVVPQQVGVESRHREHLLERPDHLLRLGGRQGRSKLVRKRVEAYLVPVEHAVLIGTSGR